MSTSPLRPAMIPVTRQMRAYFAPVNRTTETPTIFDPAAAGVFALTSPPIPWLDLGWIEGFERYYGTPTNVVRSGTNTFPAVQFRGPIDARVEFDFREWGKLQMALAGGSEHMNVLATESECDTGALGRNTHGWGGRACGIDGEPDCFWDGCSERIYARKSNCRRCRLSAADWIRGIRDFGGVRKQSCSRKPRPELCAEGDFQRRSRSGSHDHVGHLGAASAGWSAGHGSLGTSCNCVRGPGGWIVFPGMVGAVCGGTGVRWASLLLLSKVESESGGRRGRSK